MDPSPANGSDSIPTDEATRQKILDIIDHQFDLEIYLKQREVAAIRQEIAKAESTLSDIETTVRNETFAAMLPEAPHFTRQSSSLLTHPPITPPTYSQPKRPPARTFPRSQLYGRRNDGVFVTLSCPACHRGDFANHQGFLNHCRLKHNLEFGPYEEIMLRCGTPIDESEVPVDHPVRTRPVTKTSSTSGSASKKKERPSIKVYEEDVDLDLDHSASSRGSLSPPPTMLESPTGATPPSVLPSLPPPPERQPTRHEEASKSLPEKESSPQPLTEERENETGSVAETTPQIESFTSAVASAAPIEGGSRFYIKRRIVVGNVSKFIIPEKREPSLKQFTHKWMIYIVGPPQAQDVAEFITGVRFHLHPSYKPNDIVDVTEPPFRLTRLGWGEFPLRVQLHFVDKRRNKSVDIIHHLKLDDTHVGKQMLGGERGIDIELDRNTDFTDTGVPRAGSIAVEESDNAAATTNVSKQKMSLLQGILKEGVRRLPLIRSASQSLPSLPYTCATNTKAYFNWPVGRRKASEWYRAHLLRNTVQQRAFRTLDDVLRTAATALSTKDVILWCREHGHTPIKLAAERAQASQDTEDPGGFCRFCGCRRQLHEEQAEDNCSRKPKDWSTRKRNVLGPNSMSSVSELLALLGSGWDDVKEEEDDVMDIDGDLSHPQEASAAEVERRQAMLERIREWSAQETMDIDNERLLDWIWSVVGQLRLKSVKANDMVLEKNGNLQGSTPNFDIASAIDQRLVVGNMMAQATRVFLSKLVGSSMALWQKERESDEGEKMLVPHHIYQAIQQEETFDFLTNRYMGR